MMDSRWFLILSMACMGMLSSACQAQPGTSGKASMVSGTGAQGVQLVDAAAAEKLMASTPGLQVLDVRTQEEVSAGTLNDAKAINWFDSDFATQVENNLDKGRPVLVYCKAGGRSAQAAKLLVAKGFSAVYDLEGGITAWKGGGHPVQK
jgi:rhodanese-related sulfurtransferase